MKRKFIYENPYLCLKLNRSLTSYDAIRQRICKIISDGRRSNPDDILNNGIILD